MNYSHLHPPERSSRKRPSKRFFKNLIMPPVGHPQGVIPEEFQPHSDPKRAHFAVICCAAAVLLLGIWLGFVQFRKLLRKRTQPIHASTPPSRAPNQPPPVPGSPPVQPSR